MRRTFATFLSLAALTGSALAEPCVWGTNRPAIDVIPTQRIDPNAKQMRCDMTVTERTDARGNVSQTKTWNFSLGNASSASAPEK